MQIEAICCNTSGLTEERYPVAANYRVTLNLEEAEYRTLTAISQKHRESLAWLGRKAMMEFLERFEQDELQLPLILAPESPETAGQG